MWWLLAPLAYAAGAHTGIPVRGVEGLGEPQFQSSASGWTARLPHGLARVYVGPTEEAARGWIERMLVVVKKSKPRAYEGFPADAGLDEAWGDGDDALLVRAGNVGIMVQVTAGARDWVMVLHDAISDEPAPPPAPASLVADAQGTWTVMAPGSEHTAFVGGRRLLGSDLRFDVPPAAVVTWDAWGRATLQHFDEGGQAVSPPPEAPPASP